MSFTVKGSSVVWSCFGFFCCKAVSPPSFCCSTFPNQSSICSPSNLEPSRLSKHVAFFFNPIIAPGCVFCFRENGERCLGSRSHCGPACQLVLLTSCLCLGELLCRSIDQLLARQSQLLLLSELPMQTKLPGGQFDATCLDREATDGVEPLVEKSPCL